MTFAEPSSNNNGQSVARGSGSNRLEAEQDVAGAFAVYLERVRLLLQRYILELDITDFAIHPADSSSNGQPQGSALRWLMGLPPTDDRRQAIEAIEAQLRTRYADLPQAVMGPGEARFEQVRREFRLSDLECDALWLMLAAKLVPRFLTVCRSLWGDADRSLFDRTFLFHVLDPSAKRAADLYRAFEVGAPLFAHRLVVELRKGDQEEADGLLVPSRRLVRHLLHVESDLPNVSGLVALHAPAAANTQAEVDPAQSADPTLSADLVRRIRAGFAGSRRFLVIGTDSTGPLGLVRRILSDQGVPLIEASVPRLLAGPEDALGLLLGEARLRRAGLYFDGVEVLDRSDIPDRFYRRFFELLGRSGLTQFYRTAFVPSASLRLRMARVLNCVELRLELPEPDSREVLWRQALGSFADEQTVRDVAFAARAYPFGRDDIQQAVELAWLNAKQRDFRNPTLTSSDIESACHALTAPNIGQLAQRVSVTVGWDEVVLADTTRQVVDEILLFAHHRRRVLEEFEYGAKMGYGKGLTALFWGPSGTGKTLVSGLLAREMGLELYRIELSRLVSKYIGETEQRLAQLFDEAQANGIALLFDEADSLFAKRTRVKTSVDRYANLEVNYLLQRIEQHEGLVILTTNMKEAIDDAFTRRLRFKVEFPAPQPEERARLWRTMIPASAPQEPDLDFEALAEAYELTGGEIRNAVLRAAFYAAEEDTPLALEHLDRAAAVESRQAGRLVGGGALSWRLHRGGA